MIDATDDYVTCPRCRRIRPVGAGELCPHCTINDLLAAERARLVPASTATDADSATQTAQRRRVLVTAYRTRRGRHRGRL
jgi:hypothetical protein